MTGYKYRKNIEMQVRKVKQESGEIVFGDVRAHIASKAGDFIDDEIVGGPFPSDYERAIMYCERFQDTWVMGQALRGWVVFQKEMGGVIWQVSIKWSDCQVIGDD